MSIPKKIRFEVFKRDKFTCQYCGKSAPDVVLNCDHVHPKAKGGKDDILNLITSCFDCNQGKKDRLLSDDTAVAKQKAQLDLLQDRREQLEMMVEWHKGLRDLKEDEVATVAEYWAEGLGGHFIINDSGRKTLKKLITKFSIKAVLEAIDIALHQYITYSDNAPTRESVEVAWAKIGGICALRQSQNKVDMPRLFYIRGILRKRLHYFDNTRGLQLLKRCAELDASMDGLTEMAKSVPNWTRFREITESYIAKQEEQI